MQTILVATCMVLALGDLNIPGRDYTAKGEKYRVTEPPASLGDGPFPLLTFFHARFVTGSAVNGYSDLIGAVAGAPLGALPYLLHASRCAKAFHTLSLSIVL